MNGRFAFTAEPIRPEALAEGLGTGEDGAIVSFVGVVRGLSRGRRVLRLEYEAFEPMARAEMERIFAETGSRFRIGGARVEHRLGTVALGEPSIAIVVAAPRRADALGACRHLIDRIKESVPIWKKEIYEDGSAWVGDRS